MSPLPGLARRHYCYGEREALEDRAGWNAGWGARKDTSGRLKAVDRMGGNDAPMSGCGSRLCPSIFSSTEPGEDANDAAAAGMFVLLERCMQERTVERMENKFIY